MLKPKTWLEISRKNLLHNLQEFCRRVGDGVDVCPVLKSNAYGHGLEQTAEIIQGKTKWLAVDSVDEACQLKKILKKRGSGQKNILILGYTLSDNLEEVVKNGFHQVVANLQTLKNLEKICHKLNLPAFVHLKIETGTARRGIWLKDLSEYLKIIKNNPLLRLAGISTHFANIEDTTEHEYAKLQLKKYKKALESVNKYGFSGFIKHTACSAAAILFSKTHFDLIRPGISLYGMWSSPQTRVSAQQKFIDVQLKPVMTWKTKVAHIKELPAQMPVGYGCTEKVSQKTLSAVLPIGYWDGFDRCLSSIGQVLINGQRCRILGRVFMNMIVVDVSAVKNIELEDEAVILGRQKNEFISAEEIAEKVNTINYEVTTRLNPKIKRTIK